MISNACSRRVSCARAFTLIELLMALAMAAAAMAVAFSAFHAISKAWQRGQAMADGLNRGDYVMDQLSRGLRSAFYPPVKTRRMDYGFVLENDGDGALARDAISWVKTGDALLSAESAFADTTHRIRIAMEKEEDGSWVLASRAWPPHVNPELFDFNSIAPLPLSRNVIGFDCRVSTNRDDAAWEWMDEWEDRATNYLPLAVEVTVYLEPPGLGDEPLSMSRLVEIPLGPHSWNVKPARKEPARKEPEQKKVEPI